SEAFAEHVAIDRDAHRAGGCPRQICLRDRRRAGEGVAAHRFILSSTKIAVKGQAQAADGINE
ncbi:MAG: hypothetical protein QOI43_337, partial [Gaiellales bacterium]|nr:hypothetical protein [Gaiellales bacterium]